jgi:hypothetical protein
MKAFLGLQKAALGLILPLALSATSLRAEPVQSQKMWLACENGQNYPIHPSAVSRENELVTGYLLRTGTGRGVHLRLVPMGSGYRYEGNGVWFDGLRGNAVLNWGRPGAEVPCTVMQE